MKLWNLFRLDTNACKPHLRRLTPPIPLHFLWNVKNLNKQKNLRYIHSLNRFVNRNCCSVFDFRRSVSALIVSPLVIKKKLKYKYYVHKKNHKKYKQTRKLKHGTNVFCCNSWPRPLYNHSNSYTCRIRGCWCILPGSDICCQIGGGTHLCLQNKIYTVDTNLVHVCLPCKVILSLYFRIEHFFKIIN